MSNTTGTPKVSQRKSWHRENLEGKGALFAVLSTVAISVGALAEIIPMFTATAGPEQMEEVTPYTPLEVAGRDIYVREGCYNCHSQMVRPFRAETLRYGAWSRAGEYAYDRPFQLGSRRIGPDLQRVGGKYPDAWHYEHMRDPRSTSPGSIMPPYPWLLTARLDPEDVQASVSALQTLGHPYTDEDVAGVPRSIKQQGLEISQRLAGSGIQTGTDTEIVALIAYLQRLGVDGRAAIQAREDAAAGVGE
ncbi:MAG: cytochrome-c oxidase, cbb3-type subunit II [Alphaproteobacteria bacterium]|nr:cytochrome-c oxidase, cbb3-type subunit II [Alphaproteobacteria bacterium]